ncbi:dienelactone hydrolase [Flavobacterium akiainvivens]|uniref:Dienelactone hydrolase n=1 Tax=Flavobacterium akiainvivens TaxID=1202724 RepID=A0A0M8MBP5_9FLAO|nr:dienelactone hydrolase family protein [Flavobacterium akiainvivens]KOS05364.1 dienelactone hydrolase [Flavobacterium akiainvivens]SFQ73957.1 Dienelactone hydrolase [Flavobacterium akiainvivens]
MKLKFALVLALATFSMNAQLKSVAYTEGSQKLNGFSASPKKALKQKPGIVVLPAWMGINDHAKEVATKLSDMGYYAFVADIYGEGNYPANTQQAGEKAGYYKNNVDAYQKRIQAAIDQVIKAGADKDDIVIIGYCFGGTGAIEAARAGMNVKGVVSFHGGLGKDASRPNSAIKAKVLVLHGADDPFVPQKDIEGFQKEMKDGKADWQMVYYANAVHAFTEKSAGNDNSKGAAYNESADRRSWQHFTDFLNELFGKQ